MRRSLHHSLNSAICSITSRLEKYRYNFANAFLYIAQSGRVISISRCDVPPHTVGIYDLKERDVYSRIVNALHILCLFVFIRSMQDISLNYVTLSNRFEQNQVMDYAQM